MTSAGELTSYHEVLARRARTFRLAAVVLGSRARDDAAVLYAFCRAADDAADDGRDPQSASRELDALERGLVSEEGAAVARAVRWLHAARGVSLEAAQARLTGVRRDVGTVRIADDAELLEYAHLVAGTVGIMMCPILGVREPRATRYAAELGMAMQITNICRDVAEDAARGRVYLPASRLRAAGLAPAQILDASAPRAKLREVIAGLLARADTLYESADEGLRFLPPRARLAVLLASRLYRAIGLELLRRGADPFRGRAVVSFWYKLWWCMLAVFFWLRVAIAPGPAFHSTEARRSRAG